MNKLVITVIVIVFATASFVIFSQANKSDKLGEITIILIDEIGDTTSNIKYDFTEEDTLFSILDENFNLMCANNSYKIDDNCDPVLFGSRVIMKIDTIETDFSHNFIRIYINDVPSQTGIDFIPLKDGYLYRFNFTVYKSNFTEIGDGS